jgi:lycopene cyclase domain-containing protein
MSYFGFLGWFLLIPIGLLLLLIGLAWRSGRTLPAPLRSWAAAPAISLHVLLAVLYTTPWDNFLVATRVWWYDPTKVSGLTLGWVPIEEYTFFILQPVLAGLWLLFLIRSLHLPAEVEPAPKVRLYALTGSLLIWLLSTLLLVSGWAPTRYLTLELSWALIPISIQLAFGADLLLRRWRLVLLAILPMTVYLSLADALAIDLGIWTIDPAQSLQIYLGGILPIEEALFFLLTNMLITFGMTLVLSTESRTRLSRILATVKARMGSA